MDEKDFRLRFLWTINQFLSTVRLMAKVSTDPPSHGLGQSGMARRFVDSGCDAVQVENLVTGRHVKVSTETGRIIGENKTGGPCEGISGVDRNAQVDGENGVALKFASHPVGKKLHGNRSIHKNSLVNIEVDDEKCAIGGLAVFNGTQNEKRGRGRPKSTAPKPWLEFEPPMSRSLWYRKGKPLPPKKET